MLRQIRFQKSSKTSDLRDVAVDGVVIGTAMIQDPRNGYRGLVGRRIVFETNSWAWGGKQRVFQTLSDLREWLQSYTHGRA